MPVLNISKITSFIKSEKFQHFINSASDKTTENTKNKKNTENTENNVDIDTEKNENHKESIEIENETYNIIYKKNNDLYLLSADTQSSENEPTDFEVQCNGLIFEKESNKLICANNNTMFNLKNFEDVHSLLNKCSDKNKKTRIEYCEDGTIIRLYNYKDTWYTATNRCIDANNSFWCSNKSFDSMFWEIFDKNMLNDLDKNFTYVFILLHKENRIVVRHTKNMLVYINRINNETLFVDYTNVFYNTYGIKRSQIIKSSEQLISHHPFKRGFIIKIYNEQFDTWNEYKYDFPEYTYVKAIRGNVPQIRYRFLELLKNKEMLLNLEKIYNENKFMFETIKNSLLKLSKTIHKLYIESHVKHTTKVDDTNIYYQTLKQLHAHYKIKNETITFDVVKEKVNSMEKHVLRKLLGWL